MSYSGAPDNPRWRCRAWADQLGLLSVAEGDRIYDTVTDVAWQLNAYGGDGYGSTFSSRIASKVTAIAGSSDARTEQYLLIARSNARVN